MKPPININIEEIEMLKESECTKMFNESDDEVFLMKSLHVDKTFAGKENLK